MDQVAAMKTALWRWGVPVVVLVVGLMAGFDGHTGASLFVELALALALAVPLLFRSRAPLAVFVVILLAVAAAEVWELDGSPGIPLAMLVASESVGRYADEPASWTAPLTVIVSALVGFFLDRPPGEMLLMTFTLVGAWFLGRSLRLRAVLKSNQQEQAALLAQRAEEREAEAAESERVRMARELHDIVGHATSLITIRLQALRRSLPPDDPAAKEIRSIEGDARQALSDMRRLVAIMNGGGDGVNRRSPQPGLADIPGLIESMKKAGYSVYAKIDELPEDLNPGVQLPAYRVIQEALTNTIRHSGGSRIEVSVAVDRENLRIDVRDDGHLSPGQRSGTGLAGMRQRVALYDGGIAAGPDPDGGYRVNASLRIPGESD